MEIYFYNSLFEKIGIIDYCASIIWTRKFNQVGDFELYIPVTKEALELVKVNRIVQRSDKPESLMVIKNIILTSDAESGEFLTVSGPSIESYIGQRIIWNQTNLTGTIAENIEQLLNENLINPDIEERKINNIEIGDTNAAAGATAKKQFTGDNLLETIRGILEEYKLGFNLLFDNNKLIFNIYAGVNRSFNQTEVPRVIFSPEFDNFITSEYIENTENYKNIVLVAGEGEGINRKTQQVGAASGPERIEEYVDARDISSSTEGGTLTPIEYNNLLIARGQEKLAELKKEFNHTGQVEPSTNYIFEKDYFLGDIIEIINEYGSINAARITEVIESWDENGYTLVPTFKSEEE